MKLRIPGMEDVSLKDFIERKIDDTRFRVPDGETDEISDMLGRLLYILVSQDRLTPTELAFILGCWDGWSEGLNTYVAYDDARVRFIKGEVK